MCGRVALITLGASGRAGQDDCMQLLVLLVCRPTLWWVADLSCMTVLTCWLLLVLLSVAALK